MKNLTTHSITIERQDGKRITLDPIDRPPVVRNIPPTLLGYLGNIEIIREAFKVVDFGDLVLAEEDQPFIVSKEVFDAIEPDKRAFVTPDPDATITSGLGTWHIVRRFLVKAGAVPTASKTPS